MDMAECPMIMAVIMVVVMLVTMRMVVSMIACVIMLPLMGLIVVIVTMVAIMLVIVFVAHTGILSAYRIHFIRSLSGSICVTAKRLSLSAQIVFARTRPDRSPRW